MAFGVEFQYGLDKRPKSRIEISIVRKEMKIAHTKVLFQTHKKRREEEAEKIKKARKGFAVKRSYKKWLDSAWLLKNAKPSSSSQVTTSRILMPAGRVFLVDMREFAEIPADENHDERGFRVQHFVHRSLRYLFRPQRFDSPSISIPASIEIRASRE